MRHKKYSPLQKQQFQKFSITEGSIKHHRPNWEIVGFNSAIWVRSLMGQVHGWTADALRYVLPPIKNGDLFVLNSYKDKLYIKKFSNFQKKLIDTITTSNLYLKLKENNENAMAAQVFWGVCYSSRRPSQIGPTSDFDGAAIPPPIFSMVRLQA